MRSWTSITLGVASMEQALELWVDAFGFEVAARREGDDHGQVSTLAASGQAIHFYSPAGFWIEVFSE